MKLDLFSTLLDHQIRFNNNSRQTLRTDSLHRYPGQAGQAGIVVLLITVVLVTIGLSIASRSVTDIRFSRQEEETTRAFDAAEAGVEDALRQDIPALIASQPGCPGCANVSVTVGDPVDGIVTDYTVSEQTNLDIELLEGETVEVNLNGLVAGNQLRVRWGTSDENCTVGDDLETAALVATFYNTATGAVRRQPFDVCGGRRGVNQFNSATNISGGGTGYYSELASPFLALANNDEDFARFRIVYGPNPNSPTNRKTPIFVEAIGGPTLPAQYYLISSEAQTVGGETRAVEVTRTLPAPASIFDFALFTGGSVTK